MAPKSAKSDIFIYVNNVIGKDKWIGSSNKPVKTYMEAIRRLPCCWYGRARIILAKSAIPYVIDKSYKTGTHVGPDSSPLAIVGDYNNVLSNKTVLADVSDQEFTVVGGGLVPGAHRRQWVRFTNGTNNNALLLIRHNTATSIKVLGQIAPAAGSKFNIQTPGVILDPSGNNYITSSADSVVAFHGIRFGGNGTHFFLWTLSGDTVFFWHGCMTDPIDFVVPVTLFGASLVFESPGGLFVDATQSPFPPEENQAGFSAGHGFFGNLAGEMAGRCVVDNIFLLGQLGSGLHMAPFDMVNCSAYCENGVVNMTGFFDEKSGSLTVRSTMTQGWFGSGDCIGVDAESKTQLSGNFSAQGISGVTINNADSSAMGIRVSRNSTMSLGDVDGACAGYGIGATKMSRVLINQGGPTTISGAIKDTLVGASGKNYADLPYTEDLCRIE